MAELQSLRAAIFLLEIRKPMPSFFQYGDTVHTLVERKAYKGLFLPGFKKHHLKADFFDTLPKADLTFIDHCVGNQGDLQMESVAEWYEKVLQFHRFILLPPKVSSPLTGKWRIKLQALPASFYHWDTFYTFFIELTWHWKLYNFQLIA